MIRLKENERIDWFRITVELKQYGIGNSALSKMTGIPTSTLDGWRNKMHRPKFEEAAKVLNTWFDITGKCLDNVPIYNVYLPDVHPNQPKV